MFSAFCEAYYYSATPVGAFKELLAEFIELLGKVLDGSYSDADDGGAVAKSLKTIDKARVKDMAKSLVRKKAEEADPEAPTPKPVEPKPEDKPADPKPADDPKNPADNPEDKPEDKPNDDKKPVEDEEKKPGDDPDKEEPKDDLAKGGSNDQPGAQNDDELDLEAELTADTQAQIDSALEEDDKKTT
jgi:outer membrane biosynthesis protein TonB